MEIPDSLSALIEAQPPQEQDTIFSLLEEIEDDPSIGTALGFPYADLRFIYIKDGYLANYRVADGGTCRLMALLKTPTVDDMQDALQGLV